MANPLICVFNPVTFLIDEIPSSSIFSGAGEAGQPIVLNAQGVIDPSLFGQGTSATAGELLVAGALVNLYNSGGVLFMQNAYAAATGVSPSGASYPVPAVGFVSSSVSISNTAAVQFSGTFLYSDTHGEFSSASIGSEVYLRWQLPASTNTGGVTLTPPSGGGLLRQAIGTVVGFTAPNTVLVAFTAQTSSGSGVTSITAGTGLTGGTITVSGTIALGDTTVIPGSYTNANITVDQKGRITLAANGSGGGGSGTVTSVITGTGLTGGTITVSGTIALGDTTVIPGSYTNANITVDQQGRITVAANGSGGGGGFTQIAEVILGVTTATIAFNAIPQTFRNLRVVVTGAENGSGGGLGIQFNGDTGTNYDQCFIYSANSTPTGAFQNSAAHTIFGLIAISTAPAGQAGSTDAVIYDYTRTAWWKNITGVSTRRDSSNYAFVTGGTWQNTAAITSMVILCDDGASFVAGTVATLYGF